MYYIKETYLVNGLTFFTLELNQKKKKKLGYFLNVNISYLI